MSLLNYVIALLIDEVRFLITTRMKVTGKAVVRYRQAEPCRAKAVSEQPYNLHRPSKMSQLYCTRPYKKQKKKGGGRRRGNAKPPSLSKSPHRFIRWWSFQIVNAGCAAAVVHTSWAISVSHKVGPGYERLSRKVQILHRSRFLYFYFCVISKRTAQS